MVSKLGKLFMMMGVVLMSLALSLLFYNYLESKNAMESAERIVSEIKSEIDEQFRQEMNTSQQEGDVPSEYEVEIPDQEECTVSENDKLQEITKDGYAYIGYLKIPVLELELPVMSDWDYQKLELSPCRFSGDIMNNDLVIAAHNYASHFGKLQTLSMNDGVIFINMKGQEYLYRVEVTEQVAATDIDEMIDGQYELTLFTCTHGGQARVAVRCSRVYRNKNQ